LNTKEIEVQPEVNEPEAKELQDEEVKEEFPTTGEK